MHIELDRTGTPNGLRDAMRLASESAGAKGLIVFAAEANGLTPDTIDPILAESSLPLIGGVFPEILSGNERLAQGTLVVALPVAPKIQIIRDIGNPDTDLESQIEGNEESAATQIVFIDGLAPRVGEVIDALFNVLGLACGFIGGGAGSLSFQPQPCLMTKAGMIANAAVLASVDLECGIGVNHGFRSIDGPFLVTESEGNEIITLNWEPAIDVYRRTIESVGGDTITQENFFSIAKCHPFGIHKANSDKVVRDPIQLNDTGSVTCVGSVPTGCHVDILQGDADSLIDAAGLALISGQESLPPSSHTSLHLLIDCISRALLLGDAFQRELDAVHQAGYPVVGALTLGEIANTGRDFLEFYNKTIVIGAFGS